MGRDVAGGSDCSAASPLAVELVTAYPGSFSDRNMLTYSGQQRGQWVASDGLYEPSLKLPSHYMSNAESIAHSYNL